MLVKLGGKSYGCPATNLKRSDAAISLLFKRWTSDAFLPRARRSGPAGGYLTEPRIRLRRPAARAPARQSPVTPPGAAKDPTGRAAIRPRGRRPTPRAARP